jgi:hypothetical protein
MHRDLKLANLLVSFPEYPYDLGVKGASKALKKTATEEFLKTIDLTAPGRV